MCGHLLFHNRKRMQVHKIIPKNVTSCLLNWSTIFHNPNVNVNLTSARAITVNSPPGREQASRVPSASTHGPREPKDVGERLAKRPPRPAPANACLGARQAGRMAAFSGSIFPY